LDSVWLFIRCVQSRWIFANHLISQKQERLNEPNGARVKENKPQKVYLEKILASVILPSFRWEDGTACRHFTAACRASRSSTLCRHVNMNSQHKLAKRILEDKLYGKRHFRMARLAENINIQ
jgi:hypothetical protein